MNERIKELAEQAGMRHPVMGEVSYARFNYEKFAELIVQECASVSENYAGGSLPLSIAFAIKRHFGVE